MPADHGCLVAVPPACVRRVPIRSDKGRAQPHDHGRWFSTVAGRTLASHSVLPQKLTLARCVQVTVDDMSEGDARELAEVARRPYALCLQTVSMYTDVDVAALITSSTDNSLRHYHGGASMWHDLARQCGPRPPSCPSGPALLLRAYVHHTHLAPGPISVCLYQSCDCTCRALSQPINTS